MVASGCPRTAGCLATWGRVGAGTRSSLEFKLLPEGFDEALGSITLLALDEVDGAEIMVLSISLNHMNKNENFILMAAKSAMVVP